MRSNQLDCGLHYIAIGNFSKALDFFNTQTADDPLIYYFKAIASLGALLKCEVKAHQSELKSNDYRKLLLDDSKSSFTSKLLSIKDQIKSSISAKYKDGKIDDEIRSVFTLFEQAKKILKPREIEGIDYAVKTFIKRLLGCNELDYSLRAEYLTIELKKFQLTYSTKQYLLEELVDVENSYFIRFFIPDQIKQIRKIIDSNKTDPLFLSDAQIQELYKLLKLYKYNEKCHRVFERLEECTLLQNVNANKEYKEFWKTYHGSISTEKMLVIHKIYSEFTYKKLRPIINTLNKEKLIDEKVFSNLTTMISHQEFSSADIKHIATLLQKHNDLLTTWLIYTLDKIQNHTFSDFQFKKYISYIKSQCITENIDVNKIFLYLDLLTLFIHSSTENVLLAQITDLMTEAETAIGTLYFKELCQKILHYKLSYSNFITLLNLSCELNSETVNDFLRLLDREHNDINRLKATMNDLLLKEFYLKFPERPLLEVLNDFLTESSEMRFPLDKAELKQLEQRYLDIQSIGDKLLLAGQINLQNELKKYKTILASEPKNEKALLTILAIIRIQIKAKLGIHPYNMQILNVLALINEPRRIAQIKTGEGKSTLIAILAAYHGLMNHTVDIITTSHDLAIRDAEKYSAFYRSLGLKSNHNGKKNDYRSTTYETNTIVYGTVSDFEFSFLRGETQGESYGRGTRPYDVAIVDEVDSMFIDMQRNQAILSQSTKGEGVKPETYEYIWTWMNETEEKDQTKENLQAMLKSKDIEISTELAGTWLKSARMALNFVEDREYIIDYPENKSSPHNNKASKERIIKIVNKTHTGEVQDESTRWQGGLHEILEAKHGLQIRVESLTTASISHIEYFNKYKILTGLTGTLGSQTCRDELYQLYKLLTYDSPSYKPSQKQQIAHQIASDAKAQINAIQIVVHEQTEMGRPVLVLCESIKESKDLYEHLKTKIKSIQLYNGMQTTATESILGLAGKPGVLTIATNLAGRGTDIVTTLDAERQGGLHVIMTFPAINLRVEQQAFGRTGRQGKKGTFHYILHEQQLSEAVRQGKTVDEKFKIMNYNREIHEKYISANNLINYNIIHKLFLIQSIFFALPMSVKVKHLTEWATIKTVMNRAVMQYTRSELDELDEDGVTKLIIDKFDNFWAKEIAREGIEYKKPLTFINWKLKQYIPDQNFKKLLIESILLLEDPKIDFSSYMLDIAIELKTLKLEEVLPPSPSESGHFKPFRAIAEFFSSDKPALRPL